MCIKDMLSIGASVMTIIGVVVGCITGIIAIFTYKKNTATKRVGFIDQFYDQIDREKNFKFYDLLLENDNLKIIPKSENAYLLEKLLTSFDKVYNYYEQEIINEKSLSYIACEILDLYNHPSVKEYIENLNKKYINKKYSKDIIPYSGFLWLGKHLSDKYINRK
jgi:hypothetical protein